MSNYNFKSIGKNVKIYPQAKIIGAEFIEIGDNVIIDDFVFIYASQDSFIGNYVHIASFTSITGGGQFLIEDFCNISSGVRIFTGTDDYLGEGLTNPTVPVEFRAVSRGKTHLKKHTIIGPNSVIFPDVCLEIGTSAGAGSILRKSTEPWTVYAGNPAKPIKERRSDIILNYEQQLYDKYGKPNKLYQS